jgi:transcriptional regulator with XRE-family HTH domain
MELGDNMMLLRKKKSLSQADLGKLIGTSGDVIGRYERATLILLLMLLQILLML